MSGAITLPSILGILGYLAGLGILLLIGDGAVSQRIAVGFQSPQVILWCTLVAAQVGLWLAVMPYAIRTAIAYYPIRHSQRLQLCIVALLLLLVSAIFGAGHSMTSVDLVLPLYHQKAKIIPLTLGGSSLVVLCLIDACMLGLAAAEIGHHDTDLGTELRRFVKMGEELQKLLVACGTMVGGATLATGVLQKVLVLLNPAVAGLKDGGPLFVLLYGAFGSAVIALIYIPVYLAMQSAGGRLIDRLVPQPESPEAMAAWAERKSKLAGLLRVNKSPLDQLKAGILVLTPLAGSAASLISGSP